MGASDGAIPPNPYGDLSESDATPQPAGRAARQTRNPRTVVEPDTDEDEDMEDADDVEQDEEDEEEEDEEENEASEEDAEGDEDEDEEMALDPHPPPPIIRRPPGVSKPNVTITAPSEGPLKFVETKEMEDEEDEELSELESNLEGEGEVEDEEEDDAEEDSDEDIDNSRSATPDLTKLTKRQRGAVGEAAGADLMELSNEAQKKKFLTDEEQVMRRTEMARRRKNLSEKRNEEEKVSRRPMTVIFVFGGTDSFCRWTRSTSS
jgi:Ino eighty subunit 2